MPRVPDLKIGQVAVKPTTANQVIHTNEDMFGGMQAKQAAINARGFAAVGGLVTDGLDFMAKQQAKHDQAVADQADFEVSTRMLELQRSYSQLRGADAMRGYEQYRKQFDDYRQAAEGKLQSEQQKTLFRQRSQGLMLQFDRSLSGHYANQSSQYQQQQREALTAIKADAAVAALSSGDSVSADLALSELDGILRRDADEGGAPPELYAVARKGAMDKVIGGAVAGLLASGDVAGASVVAERYGAHMTEAGRNAVTAKLKQQNDLIYQQREVDKLAALEGSRADARKLVHDNYQGEHEQAILEGLERRFREHDLAQQEAQSQAFNAALDLVRSGRTPSQLPPEITGLLTKEQKDLLRGEDAETDPAAYAEALDKMASGTLGGPNGLLRDYAGRISRSDQQVLIKELGKREQVNEGDLKEIYQQFSGLKWADIQQSRKHLRGYRTFNQYVRERVRKERVNDERFIRDMAQQWFLDGYVKDEKAWFDAEDEMTFGDAVRTGQTDSFLFQTPSDLAGTVQTVRQLVGERSDTAGLDDFYTRLYLPAVQALEEHGAAPTPEQVARTISNLKR